MINYIITFKNQITYPRAIYKLNYSYYWVIYKIHHNYMGAQTLPTKSLIYFSISTFHLKAVPTAWIFFHLNDSGCGKSSRDFSCHLQENAASSELPQERVCTSKVTEIISWDGDFIFNWLEEVGIVAPYILAPKVQSFTYLQQFYTQKVLTESVAFFFSTEIIKNHIPHRIFSNNFPT